jgi:hypothetical protein
MRSAGSGSSITCYEGLCLRGLGDRGGKETKNEGRGGMGKGFQYYRTEAHDCLFFQSLAGHVPVLKRCFCTSE